MAMNMGLTSLGRRPAPTRRRRAGFLAVAFAIALLVLCGALAMGAHAGLVLLTRLAMQQACDAAALAGALSVRDEDCRGVCETAAEFYAANLAAPAESPPSPVGGTTFDDPGVPGSPDGMVFTVGSDEVTIRHPFSNTRTQALGYDPADLICVEARRQVEMPFSGIVGPAAREVVVRGVAWAKTGVLPAIFARYDRDDKWGLRWTGSGGDVEGSIHSNTKVKFTGSDHHVVGSVEYRHSLSVAGSGHRFDSGSALTGQREYPLKASRSDVDPGVYDYVHSGNWQITGSGVVIPPGVHHVLGNLQMCGSGIFANDCIFIVEGKVNVSGSGYSMRNTTIFAVGTIGFSGSGLTLSAAVQDIALMSLSGDEAAIDYSGSGMTTTGTIYAPNGGIDFTGSGQLVQQGSLVAQFVDVSGSGFSISGTELQGRGGSRLVE